MTIPKVTAGMAFVALVVAIIATEECQGFAPTIMPRTVAFFPPSFAVPKSALSNLRWRNFHNHHRFATHLHAMSDNEAAFLSDDPFVLLGLDTPTTDKKILKRAFKKRALKFHPDVVTDIHSSPEEKKKASDRFAKINGAYEQLMGKGGKSSSSSRNTSANDSTSGWTPPHRRSGSYKSSTSSSSSSGASTDWRDYMPDYRKDSDANYDTGGDSFSQIFSDMFTGAAGAAMSGGIGGGIFNEFLEFLEGGSTGFAGSSSSSSGGVNDDADLRELLQRATIEEVAEEMDDTQMVVQQLEQKARTLDDEIFAMDAEAKMASKFSEKIALEERASELKARKQVVGGYLDRARKRLLKLQTHYKDNMGRRSSSEWEDVRNEAATGRSSYASSYSSSPSSYGSTSTRTTEPTPGTSSTEASSSTSGDDDSWKTEGFGSSSGRSRRGSGRRRARNRSSAGVDSNPPPSPAPSPPPPSPSYSTSSSTNTSSSPRQTTTTTTPRSTSSAVSRSNYSNDVPPHRRARGSQSFASRQEEDRKRMQEIKVDEEFDKLKKELGL